MAITRKWRRWELPRPDELYVPAAQAMLREWLAGMGPPEMHLWQTNGGWIPPELIEVFRQATVETMHSNRSPELRVARRAARTLKTLPLQTVGTREKGSAVAVAASAA